MNPLNPARHIPNTITLLNLAAGCVSVVLAFEGNLLLAAHLIVLAAALDYLDGFAARLLGMYTPLGRELDSLADVVSFGVAPSVLLFHLLKHSLGIPYEQGISHGHLILALPFLVAVFSALRLAKYNIDPRQASSFIGLPTPANALFTVGMVTGLYSAYGEHFLPLLTMPGLLMGIILVQSALLVSPIPMFSFKVKSLRLAEVGVQLVFVGLACGLLLLLGSAALAPIIVLYILMSVGQWAWRGLRRPPASPCSASADGAHPSP